MSVHNSACVFFGFCAEQSSPLGAKLWAYIERHEESPAKTEVEGVVVTAVGTPSTGDVWLVAAIDESITSFGPYDSVSAPEKLNTGRPIYWASLLQRFLNDYIREDQPKIGWHFARSCK